MDDGCWTSFIRSHNNLPQVENGLIAHCPRASSIRLCARVSPGLVPKKFNLQPLARGAIKGLRRARRLRRHDVPKGRDFISMYSCRSACTHEV